MRKLFLLLPLLLCLLGCDESRFYTSEHQDSFELPSAIVEDTFKIYVTLPPDYETAGQSYQVYYLLDGDLNPDSFYEKLEAIKPNLPACEGIVVGIGYGEDIWDPRWRDYTPVEDPWTPLATGGADRFYQFLRDELIPRIDDTYRTIPDADHRTIVGHSLGGLAVIHGFLNYQDIFQKFIAASACVWWADFNTLAREEEFFTDTGGNLPGVSLVLTAGEYEPDITAGVEKLAENMDTRGYTGLNLSYKFFYGAEHIDTARLSFDYGITTLNR